MKRLLSVALTLAITFTMSLAITASGQEDLSKHKRTPLGIAKFEEYLATLPPEQAANILSDPELVYNMQMEYYWDENPVIYSTPRASLPLSNYPSGSYYSFNSKGCTCHKKGCGYELANATKKDRCFIESTQTSGECIFYKGTNSIQCKGFADYVYKEYHGYDVNDKYAISGCPGSITNDANGAAKWKDFSQKLKVGSNVRVHVRGEGFSHSFIVMSKSSSGLTIYDANRAANNCKVSVATFTWAELAKKYDIVSSAWL